MKSFLKDDEASAWAWFAALVILFVMIIVWGVFGQVIKEVHSVVNESTYGTIFAEPVAWMLLVWKWFPVILVGGIFVWAFAYSVIREGGKWQY